MTAIKKMIISQLKIALPVDDTTTCATQTRSAFILSVVLETMRGRKLLILFQG